MKVGIPKEIHPGERRVAATTETVTRLKKQGFEVMVESGAGVEADVTDEAYTEAGAEVVSDPMKVWTETSWAAWSTLRFMSVLSRPESTG